MANDLISRDDVCKTLYDNCHIKIMSGNNWIRLEEAIAKLAELPSAEQEPLTVNFAREMDRETIEKLKEGLKNAPVLIMAVNDSAQQWIPCSERLPEVGQDILMSVGGIYTAEGCLRKDGDWAQFRWDAIQRKDMVGAWMPLPEPYTGRSKDE